MSQIQSFGIGLMPPAGPILTLTGDVGGAVSPVLVGPNAGTIFVLGESSPTDTGFVSVSGNPGISTLSILPLQDTVTTNDAVQTAFPLTTFPIAVNSSIVMSAHVIGNRDDFSAACGGFVVACGRRVGGGAILVANNNNVLASEDRVGGTPQFGIQVNGNDIEIYAQGLALQTWNWTCTYTYQVQLL